MSIPYWTLDENHNPVPCTQEEWGDLYNHPEKRIVAQDTLSDGTFVSTVFLGIDHGWWGERPVLFETMSFPENEGDQAQWRYATWDEAVLGHAAMVYKMQNKLETPE